MPKAYSYLRFSTAEQMEGDSIRRQSDLAADYARRHGLELDTELSLRDFAVSGFRGRNVRTGALGAFLSAIDDRIVEEGSFLLVESLDRMSRQDPWDAMPIFHQIVNAGVTIVTLLDERTYSRDEMRANPTRIIESLLVMVRANEESATKSRRLKEAWGAKRSRLGDRRPMTARIPGWLVPVWEDDDRGRRALVGFRADEERAAVIKRIFQMTLDGIGPYGIAAALNQGGDPVFGRGTQWHRSYIVKILGNASAVGTFVPHKVEYQDGKRVRVPLDPVPDYYPAVISEDVFERVRAMRLGTPSPQRGRHANGAIQNIFGGLARCPLCGSTMTRKSPGAGHGRAKLVCVKAKAGAGCTYRTVSYDQAEEAFLSRVGWLVGTIPAGDREDGIDAEVENTEGATMVLEDELQRLLDELANGSSPAIGQRVREVERHLEELRAEHDVLLDRQAAASGPLIERRLADLEEAVEGVEEVDRGVVNRLLRQLLSGVVVNYPVGMLHFEWKHGGESVLAFAAPVDKK